MRAHLANIAHRVRVNHGFTLVESLVALLIFVMLSAIVAAGIPIAFKTYQQVVNVSNAELALSTTTAALRDELGMSVDAQPDSDSAYYQTADGLWHQIVYDSSGQRLKVKTYEAIEVFDKNKLVQKGSPVSLIPDSVLSAKANGTSEDIRISMGAITYNNGVFTVEGLKAEVGSWSQTVTENSSQFKVRRVLS